jgi:hypothetical protein
LQKKKIFPSDITPSANYNCHHHKTKTSWRRCFMANLKLFPKRAQLVFLSLKSVMLTTHSLPSFKSEGNASKDFVFISSVYEVWNWMRDFLSLKQDEREKIRIKSHHSSALLISLLRVQGDETFDLNYYLSRVLFKISWRDMSCYFSTCNSLAGIVILNNNNNLCYPVIQVSIIEIYL